MRLILENSLPLPLLIFIFLLFLLLLIYSLKFRKFTPLYLPLLFLRIFAFLIISLLLLRPQLLLRGRKGELAVLFDLSASMSLKEENLPQGRFASAREVFYEIYPYLKKIARIRTYTFSSHLQNVPREKLSSLLPEGEETRIFASLKELARSQSVDGVLIFSDGISTENLSSPSSLPFPVYSVGVGGEGNLKDIKISEIKGPRELSPHEEGKYTLRIVNNLGDKISSLLKFYVNGEIKEEKKVELERGVNLVTLSFTPEREGVYELSFSVDPQEKEDLTFNNEDFIILKVREKETKILLVGGMVSPEFRNLKRILEGYPSYSLDYFLFPGKDKERNLTPYQKIKEYDLLILLQIPSSLLPPARDIKEWLLEGKGLVIIGGKYSFLTSPPPSWQEIIPLKGKGIWKEEPFRPLIPPEALNHPLWKNFTLRDNLPLSYGFLIFSGRKSGTLPLLIHPKGYIITALQRFGKGKVLLHTSPSTWRWPLDTKYPPQITSSFWLSILNYLTPSPRKEKGEKILVYPVKEKFREGEMVIFRVEGGESLPSSFEGKVKKNSLSLPIKFQKNQKTIEGRVTLKEKGIYTYSIKTPQGEEKGKFLYGDPWKEWERLSRDEYLLKNLSFKTGGKYFPLERITPSLFRDLKLTPSRRINLYHPLPLYLLLLLLLMIDWFIRERYSLT